MSERFFVSPLLDQNSVQIEGPEARHIAKVMRLKVGNQVILFDGENREAIAQITEIKKEQVRLSIESLAEVNREARCQVTIATALPKGDRLKFMVEKLTEIGVSTLLPVNFERSTVLPTKNTLDKMRRYVVEASKQCERNQLMKIAEPASSQLILQSIEGPKWICRPKVKNELTNQIHENLQSLTICIGPEGGISSAEFEMFKNQQWLPVCFGPRVLRTETAAIYSATSVIAATD